MIEELVPEDAADALAGLRSLLGPPFARTIDLLEREFGTESAVRLLTGPTWDRRKPYTRGSHHSPLDVRTIPSS